jgi:ankyrin repeat protein
MNILEPRLSQPVHDAIQSGKSMPEIMALLETHGYSEIDGRSPLHSACSAGRADIVTALASISFDKINALDDGGMTPLQSAVSSGHVSVTIALLDAGADPDARSSAGRTALHYCKGRVDILNVLLQKCVQTSPADELGHTPLHRMCALGKEAAVTALLNAGAKVNASDETGRTPLHAACDESREDVALLLIKAGADGKAVDREGNTALALVRDRKVAARLLDAVTASSPST